MMNDNPYGTVVVHYGQPENLKKIVEPDTKLSAGYTETMSINSSGEVVEHHEYSEPVNTDAYTEKEKIQAIIEYKILKVEIDRLKAKLDEHKSIILDNLTLKPGTNTVQIGKHIVKVKQDIDYKVNYDLVYENRKALTEAMTGALKFNCTLRKKEYDALGKTDREFLDKFITTKPESPQLEFKAPKHE